MSLGQVEGQVSSLSAKQPGKRRRENVAPRFLTGEELSAEEIRQLLMLAVDLKLNRDKYQRRDLQGKTIALVFEKPSLRTRVSFTVAVQELGGVPLEIVSTERKKEEPEDTIRVLNGYCHGLMLRTFEHQIFDRMLKHSRIPIINGLSDLHHPCQALADILTLKERFGWERPLKVSYVGDGNNVLHSLMLIAPALGVSVHYACPKGFGPNSLVLKRAVARARSVGSGICGFVDPKVAVRETDAIYTDVWTSMGFEKEEGLREKAFLPYQLNAELYQHAQPEAVLMHCLPMVRGKEITSEMADHENSVLFAQSENRLHVQKALLVKLFEAKV